MLTKEKFNELYKIGVVGFSDENKMHPDTYTLLANLIKQICETDVKKNSFVLLVAILIQELIEFFMIAVKQMAF